MQMRSSDEKAVRPSVRLSVCPSVCLSVCPFVKRVDCDKTEERSVQIFIPYVRSFSLVFWEEEWLVGATLATWNFGSTGPHWNEIADFEPISARSSSAVTHLAKKIQLTLIGSPLRAFQWASYIAYVWREAARLFGVLVWASKKHSNKTWDHPLGVLKWLLRATATCYVFSD